MKDFAQHSLTFLAIMVLAASCYNEDNKIEPSCQDGILNQEEASIDCGGPNCDPCPPSCDNGILDYVDGWQEVGIDCGGPCADLGQLCCENGVQDVNPFDPTLSESWVDCKFDGLGPGEEASNSECPICPTCENGIHDDGEEITLGGLIYATIDCDDDPLTDCPPCNDLCDDGLLNGLEGPCIDCGGVCLTCLADHCSNGIQDEFPNDPFSNETAVDCGGCACLPCAALCGDGIMNGSEIAPDCGGNDCPQCIDPVLCGDGIQNGYETGIDCYDGVDGASACPPCQTLCNNSVQDGFETDTDCGGPDCGPCGNEDVGFLTYMVDGVLYESKFTSITATRAPGNTTNTLDALSFGGGINHPLTFFLKNDDGTPETFGEGTIEINNLDITPTPNTCSFTDINGQVYEAESDPTGITVQITDISYTMPMPPGQPEGGIFEGTFSGTLFDPLTGGTLTISDGMFRTKFTN